MHQAVTSFDYLSQLSLVAVFISLDCVMLSFFLFSMSCCFFALKWHPSVFHKRVLLGCCCLYWLTVVVLRLFSWGLHTVYNFSARGASVIVRCVMIGCHSEFWTVLNWLWGAVTAREILSRHFEHCHIDRWRHSVSFSCSNAVQPFVGSEPVGRKTTCW